MGVCLVGPPAITELRDPNVGSEDARRRCAENAPLGVLTLAAILERGRHIVDVVDLDVVLATYMANGDDPALRRFDVVVAEQLAGMASSLFGFSTMWSTYAFTLRVAGILKGLRPDSTIVFGGPQASLVDEMTIARFMPVDIVVRGEADATFLQLIEAIGAGEGVQHIAGLTLRDGSNVVRTADVGPVHDLDALPLPAYHLHPTIEAGGYLPMELGRGCPFGCSFCSTNDFFSRRFRLKSPDVILTQMRALRDEYGVSRFDLVHDMFTADIRRVHEVCSALQNAEEDFEWYCSARSDCVDEASLRLLSDAGCRGVFFGIESGSSRLQHAMGKHLDPSEAMERVEQAASTGMRTTISMIVGFPEEERADLAATVDFIVKALRFDVVDPQIHLLAPLNGTPLSHAYAERMTLEAFDTELSHSGWSQSPEDRVLIAANPDIFVSFYSVPLEHLERDYVYELRLFLLASIRRLRCLLVALRREAGHVLDVFDAWHAGAISRSMPRSGPELVHYYSTTAFVVDFIAFVRDRFPQPASYALVHAMCDYVERLEQAIAAPRVVGDGAGPRLSDQTRLLEIPASVAHAVSQLRGGAADSAADDARDRAVTVATRDAGSRLQVVAVSELLADLLRRCDGTRDESTLIRSIRSDLVPCGLDPHLVGRIAMAELRRERLIVDA